MSPQLCLRMFILRLVLLAVALSWQPAACADTFDDFVWLIGKVESAGLLPPGFPKSGDIKASKSLFNCLADAGNDEKKVLQCLVTFNDTPVGKQAVNGISGGGLPSWFWNMLDVYIDLRTGDFGGLVASLGEAAICFIAQVLTSGAIDVCAVLKELVELAENMLDAGKAIGAFIADVGTAIWDGAKAAGCALGLGGCDKGDPPEVFAYKAYFHPQLAAGLAARKAVADNAFPDLLGKLKAQALALKLPNTNKQWLSNSAVDTAAKLFTANVDLQWAADMVSEYALLTNKRSVYNNPQQIAAAATAAMAAYTKSGKPAELTVVNSCTQDFRMQFGFAHVDRWLTMYPGKAAAMGKLQSNRQWCLVDFWKNNLDQFAGQFSGSITAAGCTAAGGNGFECQSLAGFATCKDLLSASQYYSADGFAPTALKHCTLDKSQALTGLAQTIVKQLHSKRCSPAGANVICTRPWKAEACKALVAKHKQTLPEADVSCLYQPDAAFEAGMKLVDSALNAVNTKIVLSVPGKQDLPVGQKCSTEKDPLAITCKSAATLPDLQTALPAGTLLAKCPPDPLEDGADAPCYLGPWPMGNAGSVPLQVAPVQAVPPGMSRAAPAPTRRSGGFAPAIPATGTAQPGQAPGTATIRPHGTTPPGATTLMPVPRLAPAITPPAVPAGTAPVVPRIPAAGTADTPARGSGQATSRPALQGAPAATTGPAAATATTGAPEPATTVPQTPARTAPTDTPASNRTPATLQRGDPPDVSAPVTPVPLIIPRQ